MKKSDKQVTDMKEETDKIKKETKAQIEAEKIRIESERPKRIPEEEYLSLLGDENDLTKM